MTLGMLALSEAVEGTTPPSQAHTRDTSSSSSDHFNQYPSHVRSSKRVRFAPDLVVQTSDNILASTSEDNRGPGQDTDDPLPDQADANAARPEDTAENYLPWIGDSLQNLGLMPNILFACVVFMVAFITIEYCLFYISVIFFSPKGATNLLTNDMGLGCLRVKLFYVYPTASCAALYLWSPILVTAMFRLRWPHHFNKLTSMTVAVISICLFGLLSWGYCALVASERLGGYTDSTFGQNLQTWFTGSVPNSFTGCDARVELNQVSLFEPDLYYIQFARTIDIIYNSSASEPAKQMDCWPKFDMEQFRSIKRNQTLCDQGFEGDNDLYGLGIRISLYLQWLSSFLANNFLPRTRHELRKPYLIFSVAICLVTIIKSFAKACVFSIEIEIMYWMYWGGYVCVFASAPSQVRLGSQMKWIKLDWTIVILLTTHTLMIYHGAWFIWYAYDQVFSRMPCGTYHFFLFPILDPSKGFWTLRDYLTCLLLPLLPFLLAIFPLVGLLLASEVKYTIQNSAMYQALLHKSTILDCHQPPSTEHNASMQTSFGVRVYLFIAFQYRAFREHFGLPSHSRGGIRLVTPIDIGDRRLYRIRCAAMGLSSYIVSIAAVELILRWNKVSSVYSIASTGQWVALIIGVGSFVPVCWTLVRQECASGPFCKIRLCFTNRMQERSRNLKRRQIVNQDGDGIELDSLSHNLAEAINHAFSRPDIGFSTNGGAFPIDSGNAEDEAVRSLNTTRPSPNIEAFMSGTLDAQPDLEAQTPTTS